jgi:hypothetical protein
MCSMVLGKPEVSDHPVEVGQRTEAIVLAHLVKSGFRVLVPFGVNHRYDLVIDSGDRFVRVQCKTGRLRDGAIRFSTRSIQTNTRRAVKRTYRQEADVFAVYCPQTDRTYVIPVADAPSDCMYLRVDSARNGQAQGINRAADYELPA